MFILCLTQQDFSSKKNYVLFYRYIEKLSAHYGLETLLPTQKIDASSNTSKQIISTIAYYPKTSDTALSESLENFNVIQTVSKYNRSALTFIAHYTGFMKKGRRKTTWTISSHAKIFKKKKIMPVVRSTQTKSQVKTAIVSYLFTLASKFSFSFDSTRSGPFSSHFLVGFCAFDSFQLGHLAVWEQSQIDFPIFRPRQISFNLIYAGESTRRQGLI